MSHGHRRNIFGAAQRIETIHENPCDAPWWVYLKTAVPAIGSSLYMLIIPTPDEIIEEYIDPSKTRGRAKRGFQGAWRRATAGGGGGRRGRRGGFPDPDGLVASYLPGRALFASRRVSALEHVFWTGINVSDRVLFYWLVYDAGLNFVYEWHSGILESSCRPNAAAGYWSRSQGAADESTLDPGGQPFWDKSYFYGAELIDNGHIRLGDEMRCTVQWTQSWRRKVQSTVDEVFADLTLSNPTDGTVYSVRKTKARDVGETVTINHSVTVPKAVDIHADTPHLAGSTDESYGHFAFMAHST